jgi:hypothetical protein
VVTHGAALDLIGGVDSLSHLASWRDLVAIRKSASTPRGAVHNGLTVDEIKEILIHATSYCGTPAGRQCFLAVHAALESIGASPEAAP